MLISRTICVSSDDFVDLWNSCEFSRAEQSNTKVERKTNSLLCDAHSKHAQQDLIVGKKGL